MKKSRPQAYQEWLKLVIKQMSHLSKPQAIVLGMWSFGIAMTHFCGLSTVSVFIAEICWYGMRSWIECLFKDMKRGGFGWHHTKMTDPQRAERLWLAIAVATLYLVSIGGQAESNLPASSLPPLNEITSDAYTEDNLTSNSGESSFDKPRLDYFNSDYPNPTRLLSCFRRGFLVILASVIKGMPLPRGRFIPDFSPAPG